MTETTQPVPAPDNESTSTLILSLSAPCLLTLLLYTDSSLEYKLVDANRGIQKVRVEPATRSAVATSKNNQ